MKSHGFTLLREEHIDELNTDAQIWRHEKTGAELLSLSNDDENKVFTVTFRTPPHDSTGVPHIMEHCVLGGSQKYPVKEPFIELIKGSLYTFVNAFTAPDRTYYPVASTNLKDFYNLVDVYLDAIFYPLITPFHLQQEGWHYELEDINQPLVYKGVVFNEMKGAYSSPDNVLYRYGQQTLFPDTPYGVDSGGDPEVIPDLTYEQFKVFHDTYYHPSNSRIFFYGDDDVEERLRIMDAYLSQFEMLDIDSQVALQEPFSEPRHMTFPYSVEEGDDSAKKAMIDISWGLPEATDPELVWGLSILSHAIVGTQASPLRKALIDSGLGEDLTGSGFSTSLRQMTFSVGMKGILEENAEKVETLVYDTLRQLAAEGLEPDMIEAAVNSIEFSLRENNTGSFPRGLGLLMRTMNTWNYGRDPLIPLRYEAPLTAVKAQIANNPTYFQDLIKTYLLDNTHRVTLLLVPDATLNQRKEAAEKEKLAAIKAGMSEAELEAIIANTIELKKQQETPDTPEALATIPRLTLADLDKASKTIPSIQSEAHGSTILFHDLFTNGIIYLEVGFNLKQIPTELLPYVKHFGRSLLKMGTETEDFVKLSQRIGRKTGGIHPSYFTSTKATSSDSTAWMFLHGKASVDQSQELLDIIRDMLLTVKLDNQDRFRQIVLEAKARQEAGLIPGGHQVVNGRLCAKFTEADWVNEQMGGITQLLFLRQLSEDVENDWPSVLAKLEAVRQHLLNRNAMICNVTLDEKNWTQFQPKLQDFISTMPTSNVVLADWSPVLTRTHEGLTIPAQVNYVGKGANLYDLGYKLHGSNVVIRKFLGTTYLWEKVRVQGGAYGGFCSFDRDSGVFNYLSYRDPNLEKTVDNYDGTADFLRHLDLHEAELTKSIIGAIGGLDAYKLPDAKGFTALSHHLIGLTDEARQQYRNEVLSTTAADFKAFAEVLAQVNENGVIVILGSADAINAANGEGWMAVSRVM